MFMGERVKGYIFSVMKQLHFIGNTYALVCQSLENPSFFDLVGEHFHVRFLLLFCDVAAAEFFKTMKKELTSSYFTELM